MGKTALQIRLSSVDESSADFELLELENDNQDFGSMLKPIHGAARMDLWVKREEGDSVMTKIFVATLIFLITIANVLMGCELNLGAVLSTVKQPMAPLIGCFTQFLLMPLIAYAISHIVLLPRGLNSFALGLFVTGCSPGGGASNFWTLLLEGNVNLSITMTFISTLASIGKLILLRQYPKVFYIFENHYFIYLFLRFYSSLDESSRSSIPTRTYQCYCKSSIS